MRKTPFKESVLAELEERGGIPEGISHLGYLSTSDIVFSEEVRHLCEGNQCRQYNKTWACPPAIGSYEECRSRCLSYSSAMIFSAVYQIEDSFDYEGMMKAHAQFKEVCDLLHDKYLDQPFLLLSNESCRRCKKCTYPDSPCRFADKLYPSVEGYCIFVNKTAKKVGIPYNAGVNTVSYFGMVCFN